MRYIQRQWDIQRQGDTNAMRYNTKPMRYNTNAMRYNTKPMRYIQRQWDI